MNDLQPLTAAEMAELHRFAKDAGRYGLPIARDVARLLAHIGRLEAELAEIRWPRRPFDFQAPPLTVHRNPTLAQEPPKETE